VLFAGSETMQVTKEQLARVATNLMNELKEQKLLDADSVRDSAGAIFDSQVDDDHGGEEYVEVTEHSQRKDALLINYVRRIGQTPMTIMINPAEAFISVILTCKDEVIGYYSFDQVPSFGKLQDKKLPLDFQALLRELETLSKLG
jgi:hypothetical protein